MFAVQILDLVLNHVEFADHANSHIGLADPAALLFRGCRLAGIHLLAPGVIPAANADKALFTADLVTAGIAVGL